MALLKTIALIFIIGYAIAIVVLYALQKRLIFYPGRLSPDYKFSTTEHAEDQRTFLP